MCGYEFVFRKRPGCALIGACALIRTNTVCSKQVYVMCGHGSRARSRDSMSNRTHCLPSGHFFNLATHMQAHARACYDFFYIKFDAVLINVASKFASFFSVYNCKILMHIYKHVQLV